MKDILTETFKDPKNYRPDLTLPLIVETGASNLDLGAVLIQEHPPTKDEQKEDGHHTGEGTPLKIEQSRSLTLAQLLNF